MPSHNQPNPPLKDEEALDNNNSQSDESDDDDADRRNHFSNMKQHSHHQVSEFLTTSWRAVETAALQVPVGPSGGGSSYAVASRLMPGINNNGSSAARRRLVDVVPSNGSGPSGETTALLSPAPKVPTKSPASSPKLLRWLGIALLCAVAYALYNVCIKKGSSGIHPILGGVILQFVAAFMGATLLAIMIYWPKDNDEPANKIHIEKPGVFWSIGAGMWVGIAEITSFIVSGMGVAATQFIPINIGGSVVFGAMLGVVLLGETVMLHGWAGVALLMAGIAMVATDPGEKVEEGGGGGEEDDNSPPLVVWIGPALFCALAYALYNICIKKGSAYVNPIVGAVILQFVAALLGTCMLGVECWITGRTPQASPEGQIWACLAGLFVGAAELLSFCVSGMGVPATQSIPIIIGGSVMFGAVLGILMLGEELMIQGWMGVVVLMIGIAFVATDPGEKMEGH